MVAKKTDMELYAATAIAGLIEVAGRIEAALVGQHCHNDVHIAEHEGPFAQAIRRLAVIADGGDIEDFEAARADLFFTFPLMRHLSGGFYNAMQEVLFAAHLRCADMITCIEAEAMLGEDKCFLRLEMNIGHIHPIVCSDGKEWCGYDATYLGEPGPWYEVRYAGYEIRAARARFEKQREDLNRWKAAHETAKKTSMTIQ